jgi:DNA-binding FrmR family transcriptional regulator
VREKTKLVNRVKRIRGQMEAVERALASEIGCSDVLHRLSAVRGAINGLMAKVMEDHIRFHVAGSKGHADATEELIDVVNSYLR